MATKHEELLDTIQIFLARDRAGQKEGAALSVHVHPGELELSEQLAQLQSMLQNDSNSIT